MAIADQVTSLATGPLAALLSYLRALRKRRALCRQRRGVYLQTLRELQSYRPHELADLGIQQSDLDILARRQAGW